jgi:hypothetical protein
MLRFLAEHAGLFRITAVLFVVVLAASVAWITLRSRPAGYQPRHGSPLEATTSPWYVPRHAPEYHARHAATVEPGHPAALGQSPDGDLVLTDDTHELAGVAA